MRIESFQPAIISSPSELGRSSGIEQSFPSTTIGQNAPAGEAPEFSQVLGKELGRVNDILAEADKQAQLVSTGQADDLQQAMTSMAEADLALQVTMRVTQKAIAAYQEISRMQV